MPTLIKKLRQFKPFRIAFWKIVVVLLTFIWGELGNIPIEYYAPIAFIIDTLIKYINVSLLWDIGVEEKKEILP